MKRERRLVLLLLFCIAFPPSPAQAGEGLASMPADLPVSIHFNSSWNTDDGKVQLFEKGTCSVHVYGRMKKMGGDNPFYAHYVPEGVSASFNYSETIIARPYDGKGPCKGVVGRVTASGKAGVTEDVGVGKASIFLQAFSGPLGIGAFMQAMGDPGLADPRTVMERMQSDPAKALYTFSLSVPVSAVVREKTGCETLHTAKLDFPVVLTGIAEMGRAGLTGNFSWPTSDPPNTGVSVEAVGGKVQLGPQSGGRKVGHAAFSWAFGEVEPTVALFLVKEGERFEFTGEEAEVLAGRKVKLEAEVFPYADEGAKGTWVLPVSSVAGLEGYDRGKTKGRVIPLTEGERGRKSVVLYCLDGSFRGKSFPLSYVTKVKGRNVEGKAKLKVYAPEAEIEVIPEKKISIGRVREGAHCSAYLGHVGGGQSLPGIEVRGRVRFPPGFDDEETGHELAYVQLLKVNILERKGMFGRDGGDYFQSLTKVFSLDNQFPYAGLKGRGRLDMNDTPSDEIGPLTLSIHHRQEFQTTFVVRPGSPDEAIWLPLVTLPWSWRFNLDRVKDNPGWDEGCVAEYFKLSGVSIRLPGPLERFSGKPEDVPHWEKVLDENTQASHHRDDAKWKADVEAFMTGKD